jgi:hypothetical protein
LRIWSVFLPEGRILFSREMLIEPAGLCDDIMLAFLGVNRFYDCPRPFAISLLPRGRV